MFAAIYSGREPDNTSILCYDFNDLTFKVKTKDGVYCDDIEAVYYPKM